MGKLKKFFSRLGPGLITGASDDDPSGIATYSIAGASFGYALNWLTLFLYPLMTIVQEMCGRIGMVTGKGLAGVIKANYPKTLLYLVVFLLLIANTINIGADIGAMAASAKTATMASWGEASTVSSMTDVPPATVRKSAL